MLDAVGNYLINWDNVAHVEFPEDSEEAIVTFVCPHAQSAHERRFSGEEAAYLRGTWNYYRAERAAHSR